jgi:hypothetical protein
MPTMRNIIVTHYSIIKRGYQFEPTADCAKNFCECSSFGNQSANGHVQLLSLLATFVYKRQLNYNIQS